MQINKKRKEWKIASKKKVKNTENSTPKEEVCTENNNYINLTKFKTNWISTASMHSCQCISTTSSQWTRLLYFNKRYNVCVNIFRQLLQKNKNDHTCRVMPSGADTSRTERWCDMQQPETAALSYANSRNLVLTPHRLTVTTMSAAVSD